MQALEIEIDGAHNESHKFLPLDKVLRGKFDFMRGGDPALLVAGQKWPGPIPGQRIGLTPDGVGYLSEPLRESAYAPFKEKIEKMGQAIEQDQLFEEIDTPTWLYWIAKAVECGVAKVVKGKLPDVIEGKPRLSFILSEPEPTSTDKLTEALTAQTQAFNRLSDVIVQLLEKK